MSSKTQEFSKDMIDGVTIECARIFILRQSNFDCVYDTLIDADTLQHVGTCDECPIRLAEAILPLAEGNICRRERHYYCRKDEP